MGLSSFMHIYSAPRAPYYRSQRSHDILLTAATVLELLDEDGDEYIYLCGRMLDTKTITQTRKTVEEMFSQLGGYAKQAWKSDLDRFNEMHETLRLYLEEEFGVGERSRGATVNGEVSTRPRLSAAICYYCGASVYDLMLTHGLGRQTIYNSIYGVANAMNKCPNMDFNAGGASFPSHDEQREIAAGFKMKSAADFDRICLAVDGMLVWTNQLSKED
ncbi:hypothetical protein ACHAXN_001340 [Cyclotella atomus]